MPRSRAGRREKPSLWAERGCLGSDSLSLRSSGQSSARAGNARVRIRLPAHKAPGWRPVGAARAEAGQDRGQREHRHRPERGPAPSAREGEGRPELGRQSFPTPPSTLVPKGDTALAEARASRGAEGPAVGLDVSAANKTQVALKLLQTEVTPELETTQPGSGSAPPSAHLLTPSKDSRSFRVKVAPGASGARTGPPGGDAQGRPATEDLRGWQTRQYFVVHVD